MKRREHLRVPARLEGKQVHEEGRRDEGERQPEAAEIESAPFPDKVSREQRQDQEADVPGVESVAVADLGVAEELGRLDGQRGGRGRTDGHCRLDKPRPARLAGLAVHQHQLFPQALRMLPGELSGESVQAAHPLHRHQEGFVRRQTGIGQRLDLISQVAFQLFDVRGENRPAAAQVGAPFGDLSLQSLLLSPGTAHPRQLSCSSGCPGADDLSNQRSRRMPSTTCHCRRWTSNCSRPRRLIR